MYDEWATKHIQTYSHGEWNGCRNCLPSGLWKLLQWCWAVGGRAHRAQIASSIEWQRIQVKRYEWDDEQQSTKKIDNENTNWQCRSVATPNKENWYNICLQMTCHTFIWLHDWNNQWKLLYRTQILSLASNICILHGANERPWCSYSPYSLSLSHTPAFPCLLSFRTRT